MKKRVEELDALRGLAALMVVFFHFTMYKPAYNHFFKLGTTGVDLFFMISGFVIFMSLQHLKNGRDFVISRISRLFPTYWSSVTFTFMILASYLIYMEGEGLGERFIQYLGNLTMLQYYLRLPDLDRPYWTMIIELIFYLLMLIIFQFRGLKYTVLIGLLFCTMTVIATNFFWNVQTIKSIIYWVPLLPFLPLFYAGILFYKIYANEYSNRFLYYIIIIFCLICQFLLFPYGGRSSDFINQSEYLLMLLIYFTLFTLLVNNKLGFIINDITLFLGKISFALYLTHQFISLNFIIPYLYERYGLNFWIVTVFIDLPIIIGIATFITYKIEVPGSQKLKEKLQNFADWQNRKSVNRRT